tara:strand:+ start:209 stop:871 length:663 start_codon:yes stop_codon:yes gene_type:complete
MAPKPKKKKSVSAAKKKKVAKLIKKFPKSRKALLKTALYGGLPAFYVGKGIKDSKSSLGETLGGLNITDPHIRNAWGEHLKGVGEGYSKKGGWKDAVSDIGGTIWDFLPHSLPFGSDIGFGSKPAGAGSTLKPPGSKKGRAVRNVKLEDLSPSQLRQYKSTLGGFGNITEERRRINELLKGKKKGGKVIKLKTKKKKKTGRPKGVGCATKGYGKAMKRGK